MTEKSIISGLEIYGEAVRKFYSILSSCGPNDPRTVSADIEVTRARLNFNSLGGTKEEIDGIMAKAFGESKGQ